MIRKCVMCQKYKCALFTPMIKMMTTNEGHKFYACEDHFIFATQQDFDELNANIRLGDKDE